MVGGPGKAVWVTMSGRILQEGHYKLENFTGFLLEEGLDERGAKQTW